MSRKYACYNKVIKQIIGVGPEEKLSITDIIEHPLFIRQIEHLHVADFKKEIRREIWRIIKEIGKDLESNSMILVEEKSKGKGQKSYYYWASAELKYAALGRDEVPAERHLARAIVFQFVDEYLEDFLPPSIVKSLGEDINDAYDDLINKNCPHKKLQFYPSGFEIGPSPIISENNKEDWNAVYDALTNEYVIQAEYKSLHQGIIPDVVNLSLQRIQYVNHKILALCYVHKEDIVKTFEVSRLKNVSRSSQFKYKAIDFDNYEKPYELIARVNTGVKDYFKSVRFGYNFKEAEHEADDSWIITSIIKIPDHFSKNKQGPDPFFIANFLSGFADSLEVIKPDFLREEMKRRADNLSKLYSEQVDSISIISKSPHEQTGNSEKLKEIQKTME